MVCSPSSPVILTHDDEQARVAREVISELTAEQVFPAQIVTEVVPLTTFYPGEAYHQNYYRTHELQPYCSFVIAPKLSKFRKKFASRMRA
jgi:peptide-methionine (S)-S-oxide reductase